MSYNLEIADSSSNILEIETVIGDQQPILEILQEGSPDLSINNTIALLPSDFNDNVEAIVSSFLYSGYGVSILPSGDYLLIQTSGLQPSGNYSLINHKHYSDDVLNFASSVSGLLPVKNILSGSGINVVNSNGAFSIAVTGQFGLTAEQVDDRINDLLIAGTGISLNYNDNLDQLIISTIGLQPSGDYADRIHFHYSSDTLDFDSSVSGLLPVKNLIGGNNITVVNNSGEFLVAVTGQLGLTAEQVDDRVSSLLNAGSYISINYNDAADSLVIAVTGLQPSGNYSIVGHNHNITDINNLQLTLDSKQPSGNYSLVGHSHILSDISGLQLLLDNKQPSGNYAQFNHQHLITDVSGLQASLDSKQPSGSYAALIHNHYVSDIIDFNSGVSGLLPVKSVVGNGYSVVVNSNGIYTISTSGLQPSGNYSLVGHSHSSSDISNFNTSVSGLINGIYAPLNSPNLTGVPTAPTASSGTSNTQIANTQFVRTEISNLVSSAPATLDTLNELATALGNDPNFATTISNSLGQKANLSGASFTGTVSAPSGNFSVLQQNGINVSVSGHQHSYTDITNFASGIDQEVSTLLVAGSYIGVNYDTIADTLTINATGLQPSGNYSVVGHTHTSSNITNFNSSVSGLIPTVSGGPYITSTFNSSTNNYSVKLNIPDCKECDDNWIVIGGGDGQLAFTDYIYGYQVILNEYNGNAFSFGGNLEYIFPAVDEAIHNRALKNHNHGNIGSSGNIGSTSGLLLITGNSGVLITTSGINSSYINNFNSSVSGLLPVTNITGGNNINVARSGTSFAVSTPTSPYFTSVGAESFYINGGRFTITDTIDSVFDIDSAGSVNLGVWNATPIAVNCGGTGATTASGARTNLGLAIGTNVAAATHTHTISDITNFNSSVSGLVNGIYAPLNSPTLTGVPLVPTAASGTNTNQIASTQFVRNEISNLVNAAPSTLDTLNELATALGNDANFSTTVASGLSQKANLSGANFTGPISSNSGTFDGIKLKLGNINNPAISFSGVPTKIYQGLNTNSLAISLDGINKSVEFMESFSIFKDEVSVENNLYCYSLRGTRDTSTGFDFLYDGFTNIGIIDCYSDDTHSYRIGPNGAFSIGTTFPSGRLHVSGVSNFSGSVFVNSVPVSVSGHTHTVSNITNFNSSVSGLLPVTNITGGSNISVVNTSGNYTIGVSGQLGLTAEEVDDRVSNLLVGGSGISLNYDDNANTLAISVSGLSNTINIGDGSGIPLSFTTSETLNIVGSGSTSVGYNNTTKTINISSPSLVRDYELISSTKSSFPVNGGYAPNNLDVYHNGIKLLIGEDYTATNGSTFSLTNPAISGDVVEWQAYATVPRHQILLGEVRSDYVGSTNYIGTAVAGSSESGNVWRIKKYVISDNGVDIISTTAVNVAWNNRLTATYI
jgi:hypothetical protein